MKPVDHLDRQMFHHVAPADAIKEDHIYLVQLFDHDVILTRIDGALFAFSARCPHASGDLASGELHRGKINCPDHDYRFDIRTGRPTWPEDEVCRLRQFDVRQENDQVLVRFDKPGHGPNRG